MQSPGILRFGVAALKGVIDLGHLQGEVRFVKTEQVASAAGLSKVANAGQSTGAARDLVC